MTGNAPVPKDRDGNDVAVGTTVRVLSLSGRWLDEIPEDERARVLSMVGETFQVYEIDSYGRPWVMKEWHGVDGHPDVFLVEDVALDADEMLVVRADEPDAGT